jgi:hypothetical protein
MVDGACKERSGMMVWFKLVLFKPFFADGLFWRNYIFKNLEKHSKIFHHLNP